MQEQVILEIQECDDENYDFDIRSVATLNLIDNLKAQGGLSPTQILFEADKLIHERYSGKNADYLQVFHYKDCTFWAMSNKLKSEDFDRNGHCVTYLMPEDW